MIKKIDIFSTDFGHIFETSSKSPAAVFNEAILPRVSKLAEDADPGGLEEAARQRETQLQQDLEFDAFARKSDDDFLAQMQQPQRQSQFAAQPVVEEDYNAPISQAPAQAPTQGAPTSRNVNGDLTSFVKNFEGFNPKAFDDYKQTSIGYGTRAKAGETNISREDAELRLSQELSKSRQQVESLNSKHGYDFAPNELDALTSFTYNVGSLNQLTENGTRDKATIARKMLEYNKAGGEVLNGLVNRRRAEQNLFTQGY